jgi:hypothetical protein
LDGALAIRWGFLIRAQRRPARNQHDDLVPEKRVFVLIIGAGALADLMKILLSSDAGQKKQ